MKALVHWPIVFRHGMSLVKQTRVPPGSGAEPLGKLADCLRMVRQRHPSVADNMIHGLEDGTEPGSCVRPGARAPRTKVGWQQKAFKSLHQKFHEESYLRLTDAERALMHSQHGPLASVPFTAVPTTRMTRFEAQLFRVILCQRLLFLPSSRTSRCGRQLDPYGHHRAACAEPGVLGREVFLLSALRHKVCRRQVRG